MTKDEHKDALRGMLRDTLQARFEGGRYADLARAHGYADGYMRALLDAGVLDQGELLQLVSRERRRFVNDVPVGASAVA